VSGTANTDLGRYRALYDLTGKVALVVGAGRGIGQASAHALAAVGAEVYCADADVESAEEAADSIVTQGGKASPLRLDLLDPASVRTALAQVPNLEILVSTPGINVRKAILNTTDDEVDRVLALNLGGFYRLVREAGRIMATHGRGSIIGFSSIRGTLVEPGQGIYAATKAGTTQILRALAAELGPQGVRANAIAPGHP
jgi:NAD(P)-dependent dehydrogenase (short-subunit alcohol dehydrogenase family)